MAHIRGRCPSLTAAAVALVICLVPLAAGAAPCPEGDGDGDGICDAADVCPAAPDTDQADQDGDGVGDACDACLADPANDADGDGVCGNLDLCPDTAIPEAVPTRRLNPEHWALRDADGVFDTVGGDCDDDDDDDDCPHYTTAATGGCSCEQIIAAQGLGDGHRKHGCSNGAMEEWTEHVAETACVPACDGRACGFDGCNGVCGTCPTGRACVSGQCAPVDPCASGPSCDDGDPCTVDSCVPGTGCVHAAQPDGGACDDGNPCTSGDHCVAGRCMGGVVPQCGGGGPCSRPVCTPEQGWILEPVADGSVCDDGNACSLGDVCVAGACVGGPAVVCDDGDPCTIDVCDPVAGCIHFADPLCGGVGSCCEPHPGPGCDDPAVTDCVCAVARECCDIEWMPHCADLARNHCGYPCGGGGGCATDLDCQDPDPCTYDRCVAGACVHEVNPGCGAGPCCADHPEPGCEFPEISQCVCAFAPECCTLAWMPHCVDLVQTVCGFPCFPSCQTNAECDDGNGCTQDYCAAGQCQHDAIPGCGGGSCCAAHPDPGCELPPVSDCVCGIFPHCCTLEWGPECVDAARSVCGVPCAGQCTDASECDDGDACTIDACDALGACVHTIDADCLPPGPCCEPHPGPGCADPVVSQCVCAFEPSCCFDWHPICADIAQFQCGADCANLDRDADGWPAPADCDDLNPTVFPGAPERCNGRDDDCDGLVDEAPTDCPNGTTCTPGGCVGSCTPHTCAELGAQCGLQPDGCLGVIDCGACGPGTTCDGLSCVPGECLPGMVRPCGVGACQGLELCRTEGVWGACDGPSPSPEACDLQDNDCDGLVDEGNPCPVGSTCVASVCVVTGCLTDADCAAGERCVGGVCQPAVDADQDGFPTPFDCDDTNAQTFPGAPEVCDNRDNDCDGVIDEACLP